MICSFALMPATHLSPKLRQPSLRSRMDCKRLNIITGLYTFSSKFPEAPAKVIATSLPMPDGKAEEVPLGTGMTNWETLHEIFKENGYDGYYAIEREVGEDAMGDVQRAVEFLRNLP